MGISVLLATIVLAAPTAKDYLDICKHVNRERGVTKAQSRVFDYLNDQRSASDRVFFENTLKSGSVSLNEAADYGLALVPYLAFPIIMILVSFIIFWVELPCVCCSRCHIRRCPRCRRDPIKRPYTHSEVSCPICSFLFLGIISFVVAVFGNQQNTDFVRAFDYSVCELALFHKDALFGSSNSSIAWTGASSVSNQIQSTSSGLTALNSHISDTFGSNSAFSSNN